MDGIEKWESAGWGGGVEKDTFSDKDADRSTGNLDHKGARRRVTALVTHSDRHLFRRAFSEVQLLDCCGIGELKDGDAWHFISGGDVDSLSYLKLILRHQKIKHLIVSTWCMAAEDILDFDGWLEDGSIGEVDFFVGEIFPNSYKIEYAMLEELLDRHGCGRVCVFRNHSKIMAGRGERFDFAVESSANVNTNPRTEQTVLTVSSDLYDFYKDYFGGIVSFDKKWR